MSIQRTYDLQDLPSQTRKQAKSHTDHQNHFMKQSFKKLSDKEKKRLYQQGQADSIKNDDEMSLDAAEDQAMHQIGLFGRMDQN